MSINSLQRPSLTEIAYEEIKKSICLGKLKPGHKLVVDDLIRVYNISNTPIKEALNRLVAEGLVEAVPRRGIQVKKIASREIKEIYEIRLMQETYCAKKAVKVIDQREDVKTKLLEILRTFDRLIKDQYSYDYETHTKLDEEFHMEILSLAENETLIKDYNKYKAIDMSNKNYANISMKGVKCKVMGKKD